MRNEDSAQIRILTQQEQELYEGLTKKEDLDQVSFKRNYEKRK